MSYSFPPIAPFFENFFIDVYMFMCLCVYIYMTGCLERPEEGVEYLQLELQAFVICLAWVLDLN